MHTKFDHFNEYIIRYPTFKHSSMFKNNETKELEELLFDFINNDKFISSIYWSSPEFYKLLINKSFEIKKSDKITYTLIKYIIRSTSRCTPFGSFSGSSIQSIGATKNINFNKRLSYTDQSFLYNLTYYIKTKFKDNLSLSLNDSIYHQAKYYKYFINNNGDSLLFSIEKNDYINDIYKILSKKTLKISSLKKKFINNNTSDLLINKLIDLEFIKSNIIIDSRNIKKSSIPNKFFITHKTILDKIDEVKLLITNSDIEYIPHKELEQLKKYIDNIGVNNKQLINIDYHFDTETSSLITYSLIKKINTVLTFINRLPSLDSCNFKNIESFKKEYLRRYDLEEKRLLDVLDPEIGISFPVEKGIGVAYFDENLKNNEIDSLQCNRWASDWLIDVIENENSNSIDISKLNIQIDKSIKTFPITFNVIGNVLPNNKFYLDNISGHSAKALLGRFTYMHKSFNDLYKKIDIYEKEIECEKIFAEIIFTPLKKISNVTQHLNYSDYEIPINDKSKFNNTKISLDDIYISIRNDEIILKSRTLQKEIIPRLSNAHNFSKSENIVYNFLASIQFQKNFNTPLYIDYFLSKKTYIPQIVYENIILHKQTWILKKNIINKIKQNSKPIEYIKKYFSKIYIPQYVSYDNNDQSLFIDTKKDFFLEILLNEIKQKDVVILSEWLFNEYINNEKHINQVIIPYKNLNYDSIQTNEINEDENQIQKKFLPGSDWIYMKFYISTYNSDDFLRTTLFPLLTFFFKENFVSEGFITRYIDPDYHIRFRIKIIDSINFMSILNQINLSIKDLLKDEIIWKIQLDTYEREIERYGNRYIENVENCFTADTLALSRLLNNDTFYDDLYTRILISAISTDYWFKKFNFSIEEKLQFCKKKISFDNSTKGYKVTNEYLNLLDELFKDSSIKKIFLERDYYIKNNDLGKKNSASIIHMSINRYFSFQQKEYESKTYLILFKYYIRTKYIK